MILPEKIRSWLQAPYNQSDLDKIDWLGIITVFLALAIFIFGLWIVQCELGYASWLRYTKSEMFTRLFVPYPQKIFLLTPLAILYTIRLRKDCSTNADCLKCYFCILLLFGFSFFGVHCEAVACNENWSFMWSC